MVHITNPFKNPLIRYGIIFSLIPFLVTYGLGHTLKNMFAYTLQNVAEMDATDPDRINLPEVKYIFPFACLSGIIAFIIWFFLMQKKPTRRKGLIAGILTVFLCYPMLGFFIGIADPRELSILSSGISVAITLTFFGNFLTFWITYPFGAVCGFFISKQLIKKIATDASAPSVFD